MKALRCVVEEKAETAGRIEVEKKIVKSITELITRIDNEGWRGNTQIHRRWGSVRAPSQMDT